MRQVKTSSGVSKKSYKATPGGTRLGGLIQGKRSVVAQWLVSDNSMLRAFTKWIKWLGLPYKMISPNRDREVEQCIDMYIDNAHHFVGCKMNMYPPSVEDLTENRTLVHRSIS